MMMYCDTCKKEILPYNPASTYCPLGHELRHYSYTTPSELNAEPKKPTPQNSKTWYLLPIFFSIIGGVVMYAVLRKQNKSMAKKGLILGFIMIIPNLLFIGIFSSGDVDDNDRSNYNSNIQKDSKPEYVVLDDWNYEDMLRNESFYKNKIISIKGIVSNYVQYDESSSFGLGVCHNQFKNNIYNDCIQRFWVYHDGERILEGDIVEVIGVFLEISELENAFGVVSYHPSLDSQTLVLVQSDQ